MKIIPLAKLLGLAGLVLTVAVGCATAPTQEMSDARQAIQAARDAGAEKHAPYNLGSAEKLLAEAETALEQGDYGAAKEEAVNSKKEAVSARNIALAIGSAEATLQEANRLGFEWRDSQKILDKARAAAQKGDEEAAVKIANLAKAQGEEAINQYYLESAKMMLWDAEKRKGQMSSSQLSTYRDADAAYRNSQGRKAYDLISGLMAELNAGHMDRYVVSRGDSLWGISGKRQVYDNPYQWPLIYKANRHQINDPDLIYPGQDLAISRNNSASEIDAAVRHARTRGAWAIGVVEESDIFYLGR